MDALALDLEALDALALDLDFLDALALDLDFLLGLGGEMERPLIGGGMAGGGVGLGRAVRGRLEGVVVSGGSGVCWHGRAVSWVGLVMCDHCWNGWVVCQVWL